MLDKNYKLMRHELPQDEGSPVPMPDKIFRLRTGPEEKMDASNRDEQVIAPEFVKTRADDAAGDTLQFELDYSMFVISKTLKVHLLSVCIFTFLLSSQVKSVFHL
jgi:hypothetical protein